MANRTFFDAKYVEDCLQVKLFTSTRIIFHNIKVDPLKMPSDMPQVNVELPLTETEFGSVKCNENNILEVEKVKPKNLILKRKSSSSYNPVNTLLTYTYIPDNTKELNINLKGFERTTFVYPNGSNKEMHVCYEREFLVHPLPSFDDYVVFLQNDDIYDRISRKMERFWENCVDSMRVLCSPKLVSDVALLLFNPNSEDYTQKDQEEIFNEAFLKFKDCGEDFNEEEFRGMLDCVVDLFGERKKLESAKGYWYFSLSNTPFDAKRHYCVAGKIDRKVKQPVKYSFCPGYIASGKIWFAEKVEL